MTTPPGGGPAATRRAYKQGQRVAGEPVYGGTCVESQGQVFSSTCGGGATGCTGTAGIICMRGAGGVAGGVTTPGTSGFAPMGAEPMPLGVTTGCCGIACAETGALRQTPAPKAAKLISVRQSIMRFPFWRLKNNDNVRGRATAVIGRF